MISGFMERGRLILTFFMWLMGLVACTAFGTATRPVPTPIAQTAIPVVSSTPTLSGPVTEVVETVIQSPTVSVVLSDPTVRPTVVFSPTLTPVPDTGWQRLRPGLEWREIRLLGPAEHIYLVRLEPDFYRVTIAYRAGEAQSMVAWQEELGALLLVNGGFFTQEMVATGRIIVDGVGSGLSYEGFGGMLAITAESVEVRSLTERPYDPNEPLQYALQAFPVLVKNGEIGFPDESEQRARRTVVAMDGDGRLLFIVAANSSFTLHELSRYLAESDLGIEVALNLDGGPSSGLMLADPAERIPAYVRLPAVIAVYPQPGE